VNAGEQAGEPVDLERPARHPSLDERFDPAVRIVDYDPAWIGRAEQEMRALAQALGAEAVRLEHVGSTAVPGLAAKPILDLLMSVAAIDARARYVEPLARAGYMFAPAPESPDYHFFAKPPARPRSYHLHVCQAGGAHEQRHLAVRDFLRSHEREAIRYEALKRQLAQSHPEDRLAYIAGKQSYVDGLERRALAWARLRGDAGQRRVATPKGSRAARLVYGIPVPPIVQLERR
jgi:GrpB-like predicted nucleotidyltransferase (UPF0157 family)